MSSRNVFLLCLMCLWPLMVRAAAIEEGVALVEAREYRDARGKPGVQLTFQRLPVASGQPVLTKEDVKQVLALLEVYYGKVEVKPLVAVKPPCRSQIISALAAVGSCAGPETSKYVLPEWEKRIRQDYEEFYKPQQGSVRLPERLGESRFLEALKRSPRYMPEGARRSAEELFTSPVFITSMALSMTLYLAALAFPEPFLSKGLVAGITLWLLVTYGVTELMNMGQAVKQLYEEAEAARTEEQLEAAAKNFGTRVGEVGLRILVTATIGKFAGKLPQVPKNPGSGLWARLGSWRQVISGRVQVGGAPVMQAVAETTEVAVVVGEGTTAQTSVANGTVLLMGATLGTEASAAKSLIKALRTTGGCRDKENKGDADGHHIATNKNTESERNGGPWTPRFEALFRKANMSLNDEANIVYLIGHKGSHPEEYHQEVYRRLEDSLGTCKSYDECRTRLMDELDRIAADICKPNSRLNKLTTKQP